MDYNASISMNPKLIRVGNSCYRRFDSEFDGVISDLTINPRNIRHSNSSNFQSKPETQKRYLIEDLEKEDFSPDVTINDIKLNDEEELIQENQGFVLKIHLCKSMYGFIIGKRGQTKFNIESETQTSIRIPKENENSSFVKIQGSHKHKVIMAYKRIRNLEQSFRLKQKLTHFLSIPLSLDSNIKKRFQEFKTLVLSDPKSIAKGIDESLFQSDYRLHLTLRILYLGDAYERKIAVKFLKDFQQTFLENFLNENKNEPIILHMKGLDIMNDDPSDVKVLYAKVTEVGNRGLFKQIVNKLYDWFADSGLICETERYSSDSDWKVKIHATLMNTRYRLTENENENQQSKKNNPSMDVSNILAKHKDYDFGCIEFNQIHISNINYYGDDQFYVPLEKIFF